MTDRVSQVGDDVFWIALEERTGRLRLHPRALGVTLAAALLGELVLHDCLAISDNVVYMPRHGGMPPDALSHRVLEQMVYQPEHRDLALWLKFLGENAVEDVGYRLWIHRQVERHEPRRLVGGGRMLYMPVDPNQAAWPGIRLAKALADERELDMATVFLGGLVWASGLLPHVLWDPGAAERGKAHLPQLVRRLHAPLHTLVSHTQAAVAQTVLAPR
jgi:hypothetical protein